MPGSDRSTESPCCGIGCWNNRRPTRCSTTCSPPSIAARRPAAYPISASSPPASRDRASKMRPIRSSVFRLIESTGGTRTAIASTSNRCPPFSSTRSRRRAARRDGTCLPIDERFVEYWNHDPWNVDSAGDGRTLADGASFLLPYYLGLYYGFIQEEET